MRKSFKRTAKRVMAMVLTLSILVSLVIPIGAAETFTVKYNANGGTLKPETVSPPTYPDYPVTKNIPQGETLSSNKDFVPDAGTHLGRDGYVLADPVEWYTSSEYTTLWNMTDPVTKDLNLYARWRQLRNVTYNYGIVKDEDITNLVTNEDKGPVGVSFTRHKVTYYHQVADGEKITASQITNTGSSKSTYLAPRTRGYLFDKWYTTPQYTTAVNFDNPVTGNNLTLYANWLPANDVIFNLNYTNFPLNEETDEQKLGGKLESTDPDILDIVQVLNNTIVPQALRPAANTYNRSAEGYKFLGWYRDADPANKTRPFDPTKDLVPTGVGTLYLYAHWERSINVTFDYNWVNGTSTAPKRAFTTAAANKPLPGDTLPVQTGNTNELINPSAAQRKPNLSPCSEWDGLCAANDACTEEGIIPNNSTRHGNEWSLEGWYTLPVGGVKWEFGAKGVGTPVGDKDFTLYAHWVKSHTVTYDLGLVSQDGKTDGYGLTAPTNYSPYRRVAPAGTTIETNPSYAAVLPTSGPAINLLAAERHIHMGWYKDDKYETTWSGDLTGNVKLYAGWRLADGNAHNGAFPANKITFNPNGGTLNSPTYLVPYGGKGDQLYQGTGLTVKAVPKNLSRTNYDFVGWYKETEGINEWDQNDIITADTTVYAKWKQKIAIVYNIPDEYAPKRLEIPKPAFSGDPNPLEPGNFMTYSPNSTYAEGAKISNPMGSDPHSVLFGYSIDSWHRCVKTDCVDPDCLWDFANNTVIGDENARLLLYANINAAPVILFDTNWPENTGEHKYSAIYSELAQSLIFYGSVFGEINDGFKHGLLTQPVSPTEPATTKKYLQYTQVRYGEILEKSPVETYLNKTHTRDTNINVPLLPDETKWQFVGWYTTKAGADTLDTDKLFIFDKSNGTKVEADTVLYAGWRSGYIVNFNVNAPADANPSDVAKVILPDAIPVAAGATATNPNPNNLDARNPELEGYKFLNWYTDPECRDADLWKWTTVINDDVELYAKWVRGFRVSFNVSGVTGVTAPGTQTVAQNGFAAAPQELIRAGYAVAGWYTTRNDADILNPSRKWDFPTTPVTGTQTLYAGWIKVYTVTFDVNSAGTSSAPPPKLLWDGTHAEKFPNNTHVIDFTPPTKEGWTLVGWYTTKEAADTLDNSKRFKLGLSGDTVLNDTVLYAGWFEGEDINPLTKDLPNITAKANLNKGEILRYDMTAITEPYYYTLPKEVITEIRNKNIRLDLDYGDYELHISGIGLPASTVDRNLELEWLVYGTNPWKSGADKGAVNERFNADGKNRPVWQFGISEDTEKFISAVTFKPTQNYSETWGYGIMFSRYGNSFEEMDAAAIADNGSLTLPLSLGDIRGDLFILINDEVSANIMCPVCGEPIENCICQKAPAAPTAAAKTATGITLNPIYGAEYKIGENGTWQNSPIFNGLNPNTSYTFYARMKKTVRLNASPDSEPSFISTNKNAQTIAPAAPTKADATADSITLNPIAGAEYRLGGSDTWQDSPIFEGLTSGTNYTFYARFMETDNLSASPASSPATISTEKGEQEAPAAPILLSKTHDSVTLVTIVGAQYRRGEDGIWSDSPVFTGLVSETGYVFYARMKETDTLKASPASAPSETITTDISLKPTQNPPSAPTAVSADTTADSITLNAIANAEYRLGEGGQWQDSPIFTGLTPGTDYVFFARLKETNELAASPASAPSAVITTVKGEQAPPSAPTEASKTNTSITLNIISGAEYRMGENGTWQDSPVFLGLTPNTSYTFYARMKGTQTHNESLASVPKTITTSKTELLPQAAPNAPTADIKTANSITLNSIYGAEYRMGNGNTWQDSPTFTGLTPNTSYTFYVRMKETDIFAVSPASEPSVIVTAKLSQAAPSAPTMLSKTETNITLATIAGAEYRAGANGQWQDSPTFTGLTPGTSYIFYARMKETSTNEASSASAASASFTTNKYSQTAPSAPTVSSKTATRITLNAIEGAQYSLDGNNWQDSPVFTGLEQGTSYTFYARMKETATHAVSPSSAASEPITTKVNYVFDDSQIESDIEDIEVTASNKDLTVTLENCKDCSGECAGHDVSAEQLVVVVTVITVFDPNGPMTLKEFLNEFKDLIKNSLV